MIMKSVSTNLLRNLLAAALAVAAMTEANAQEYTFTTLAGPDETPGAIDGPGSAARFCNPSGVAVDSAGNVYVADSSNNTIRKVTPAGVVTTLADLAGKAGNANGTGSAAWFNWPTGVALDSAGNLYVADMGNDTIRRMTPGGVVTTLAGLAAGLGSADGTGSAARFHEPDGVAVDSAGNVYVADTSNYTIRKVTPAGVVATLAGLAGHAGNHDGTGSAARFLWPSAVAADSAGNVYVADPANGRIWKVTPAGVVTTLAGAAAGDAVAVDSAGNVYAAAASAIQKVTPAGVVTTLTDAVGGSGVAVDTTGNVYVTAGNTIQKVTPGGVVTTLAGDAAVNKWGNPIGGYADGTGSAARFYGPEGVAVDSAGNVYVADTHNETIRKVTPAGVVTTVAGSAGTLGNADGTGSAVQFDLPQGLAVDSAGNLYVGDTYNSVVRIGGVACPDAPTIDLAFGPVGQLRQLDTSPQTAIAWQWSLSRAPSASSVSLSSANIRNPTFTPDVPDLYVFRLKATNAAGAVCIRTLAFTAMPEAPILATPPLTRTAEIGSVVFFSVEATNTPPEATSYQWYFSGANALGGATNASLELTNVQPAQAGAYTVVVTNILGAVTSDPALLSVIPPVERRVVPALHLPGGAASLLHLEYAASLAAPPAWSAFTNVPLVGAPQLCFDLSQPQPTQRFFRAWQTNGPPPLLHLSLATEIPLTGAVGTSVRIDYISVYGPTNAWVTLDTVTLTNSPQLYFDVTAFRQAPRLYRLVASP